MLTPVRAIIAKEWKLLVRDPGTLVMLFVLPALFIIVLSVALETMFIGGRTDKTLEIVFVDEDGGEIADRIREGLAETGVFRPVPELEGTRATRERALRAVLDGDYPFALVVPEGASEALRATRQETIEILAAPRTASAIATSIEAAVRTTVLATVIRDLHRAVRQQQAALDGRAPSPEELAAEPPRVGLRARWAFASEGGERKASLNSVQHNVPGWTIFALFWILTTLAVNIVNERRSGAFRRVLVAPVPLGTYLFAKLVPFFGLNLLQAVVMFAIGVWVMPLLGSHQLEVHNPGAVILLTVATSMVAISMGLLASSLSTSFNFVATFCTAVLIIMATLAGIFVPRFVLPELMQDLSWVVPHSWALDGYLGVLVDGWPTARILPHVGVLTGFAVLFFGLATLRFKSIARRA